MQVHSKSEHLAGWFLVKKNHPFYKRGSGDVAHCDIIKGWILK